MPEQTLFCMPINCRAKDFPRSYVLLPFDFIQLIGLRNAPSAIPVGLGVHLHAVWGMIVGFLQIIDCSLYVAIVVTLDRLVAVLGGEMGRVDQPGRSSLVRPGCATNHQMKLKHSTQTIKVTLAIVHRMRWTICSCRAATSSGFPALATNE